MAKILGVLIFLFGCIAMLCPDLRAQSIPISGTLLDSLSHEPLPYASIMVKGTTLGGATDVNGNFSFHVNTYNDTLLVRFIGYQSREVALSKRRATRSLNLQLVPTSYELSEVLIKPGKERYSKRDNPAVALARDLIAKREQGNPKKSSFYSYERYEKMLIALNNFTAKQQNNWVFRKFTFLSDYVDTSQITGKPILPISNKELIEQNYYREEGKEHRQVISGIKQAGADDILDEGSTRQYLNEIFQEINIYQNDINLLLNRFVSPLSSLGPTFYKYYITDTTTIAGDSCVVLGFVPFNTQSMGFVGYLYATADTTHFIKKVVMRIPDNINLNFVNQLKIEQLYERDEQGNRRLLKDDISATIGLTSSSEALYGRRTNIYRNHTYQSDTTLSVFEYPHTVITLEQANAQPEDFWQENVPQNIEQSGRGVSGMLDRLREIPVFYYGEKVVEALVNGYIPTAEKSRFDIGPVNTLLSVNSVEGIRLRGGGFTTANLNPHLFANGYVAYGTKDGKFKYQGELEYSFKPKAYQAQEFPIHSLRGGYKYDINQLGQHYLYTNKDNIFLSLKRKGDTRVTYKRHAYLCYLRETLPGFSYGVDLNYSTEYATQYVPFISQGKYIPSYTLSEALVRLRYAPQEKYYQTKTKRINYVKDVPVFTLSHAVAQKGFLGSDYSYNRTDMGIQKRFWFSAFGHLDVLVTASKVWDRVPFPLLIIPNANLSYTIQPESFSMMSPMEFISDESLSWFLTYKANGLILNRIPLIKYLKMREVFSFRGIMGNLSNKNNPALRPNGLFQFPAGCYAFTNLPYMEVSVGIENIFKVLRIDYVWRLSYRSHPGVDRSGIRIALGVTF